MEPDHPPPSAQVDLPELDLAEAVLDRLEVAGWDGDLAAPLPSAASKLDARDVTEWVGVAGALQADARIPPEVGDVYLGPAAAEDVRQVLSTARLAFTAFLGRRGVADAYLAALDDVLPDAPDRIVYLADASLDHPTRLRPMQTADGPDFGRLILEISPVDVWSAARLAAESGVVGPAPDPGPDRDAWLEAARDVGARFTAWHELTHALQRAYLHPHLPASERTSRAAWTLASHRLLDVDPALGFTWGNRTGAAFRLRRSIDERQADGVAWQVLVEDLPPPAAQRAWDVWFGRLDAARARLDRVRDTLASLSPDAQPEDLAEPIAKLVADWPDPAQREVLVALAHRLAGVSELAGHLDPLPPDQAAPIWRALHRAPLLDPEGAGRRRQDR